METCMRNLGFVQHLAALSILESRSDGNEKGKCKAGPQPDSCCHEEVFCPKPRRRVLYCCAPELIKPVYPWLNVSRLGDCEAGCEILDIFLSKGGCAEGEHLSFGCTPPYCSPPVRTGNPIVHDAQFYSDRCCSPVKPVKPRAAIPSFSPSPSVRIEGFECRERGLH